MKLITEKAPDSTPINIGHDDEVSIRELAELIIEVTGKTPDLSFDTSKPDGYPRRGADPTRLKEVTGWVPEIPLKTGIEQMVEEYSQLKS